VTHGDLPTPRRILDGDDRDDAQLLDDLGSTDAIEFTDSWAGTRRASPRTGLRATRSSPPTNRIGWQNCGLRTSTSWSCDGPGTKRDE